MKSNSIERAVKVALAAHTGQTDKGGSPYILHPMAVAFFVSETVRGEENYEDYVTAALLHDVVEDSDYTIQDLADEGFSISVLEALELLTHKDGEDYFDYVRRIKDNEIARIVKRCDLVNNCNLDRLKTVTDKDRKRYEKYVRAFNMLEIDKAENE